jgi:AcrR family transcriptional regulator
MPYSPNHKARTRARIVGAARELFTLRGFERVTIDEVMARAGLTRGGFYNHFRNKDELFCAAVDSYAQAAPWTEPGRTARELACWFIDFYLSDEMLRRPGQQCPLFALPADVSRSGAAPKSAYSQLIRRTAAIFRAAVAARPDAMDRANAIVSICVGAMVLASTTEDAELGESLRRSARTRALELLAD